MIEFDPPIRQRETEELVAIANGSLDDWQQEAIDQAKAELRKRNVTQAQQQVLLEQWNEQARQEAVEYELQLERNATESYTIGEMLFIFLLAPIIVAGKLKFDLSLSELKRENYRKKFRQRIFLLVASVVALFAFITYEADVLEKKRLKAIEDADISEWERKYYGTDSASIKDDTIPVPHDYP